MAELRVDCRIEEGQPVPVRFGHGGATREIAEIVDRWAGRGHRYFRVRTRDGAQYILRRDDGEDSWRVQFFEESRRTGADAEDP